jgi:class 3 adenylate cyclase/tetratricopeptide (TPR) repeat protein
MRCGTCGAENPGGKRFCGDCGAALKHQCARCGADLGLDQKFCSDCGTAFGSASAGLPAASEASDAVRQTHDAFKPKEASEPVDGERRHVTVLFSDLADSTEIASHLDPEEWRNIAARYQRAAAEAVARFGGHVAQYLGDGVVVYFGWPVAHEDDGERAVRGGLAIVEAIAALNDRFAGDAGGRLSVRVGIDSGSVVVGQSGGGESLVFGEVPNIAARVQSLAASGCVTITGAVHDLTPGRFVVEDCGAHSLKGIKRPVQLYRVIRPNAASPGWRRSAARGLTPFVGREDEMRLVESRWKRAREGGGQLVLVRGEPGIGKSRLVEEFRTHIEGSAHLWIECAGERFSESTPFHVVTQLLDQTLGSRGDEWKDDRVAELERSLASTGMNLDEAVPLIAELLNLPAPEKYPPLSLTADQKRRRLLASLATWVLDLARLQPLVVAIQDLHWVDPSTLELIRTLVEQAATAPLMLLCTTRPEFRTPWPMRAHCAEMTLSRLSDVETRALIAGFVDRAALSREVVDTLVKRTDGVPLFAEELTRLVLEGELRPTAGQIPATLRDSLTARLDRLGPAREVAQVAAVLGREFSYELLEAVMPAPEAELLSALESLAGAELIYTRGFPPTATYQFKHALTQDAAYEGLLKSRRRELHLRVARTISEEFPALAQAQPQTLARHWTQAGEAEAATAAWKRAGDAAYSRRAFKEAEEGYRQAREMLNSLAESPERDRRELELCSALVQAQQLTRGYSAPETVESGGRARALAEKVGNVAQLIRQEVRTWRALFVTGDYAGAAGLADRINDLTERYGDSTWRLVFAHNEEVQMRFYTGDLVGVEEHFARLSPLIETVGLKQAPGNIVITIGVTGLGAWALGRAEAAQGRIARAAAFAEASKNPYDLAMALLFEGYLARFQREPRRADAAATRMLALAEEHGLSYAGDLARGVMGWARAQLGDTDEGVSLIRQALAGLAATGAKVGITDVLTRLAEAQALDGATTTALATIDDALEANPQELVFRPLMLTCRGELRLKLEQIEPAEVDFRDAIAMAGRMDAKAWELRAAMGLARMHQARGDSSAARDLLAPLYAWFTEGFEAADLKDAKALLGQLGA